MRVRSSQTSRPEEARTKIAALLESAEVLLAQGGSPVGAAALVLDAWELRDRVQDDGTGGEPKLAAELRRIAGRTTPRDTGSEEGSITLRPSPASEVSAAHELEFPEHHSQARSGALSDETLLIRESARCLRESVAASTIPSSGRTTRTLVEKLILGSTALLVLAFGMALLRTNHGAAKWRVSYWDNRELSGSPRRVEYLPELKGDFGIRAPIPALRRTNYSIRWESALRLSSPKSVRFILSSDDGSRLFINDQLVIDSWQVQAMKATEGTVELPAGLHLIRIEFFQVGGDGKLELAASIDGAPPRPLAADQLELVQ